MRLTPRAGCNRLLPYRVRTYTAGLPAGSLVNFGFAIQCFGIQVTCFGG